MSNQTQNMITLQLHLKMQNLGLIQFNLVNYILKNHHFAVTVKKKSSQNPKNVGSMFSSAVKLETCSLLKLALLGHLRLLCCFTYCVVVLFEHDLTYKFMNRKKTHVQLLCVGEKKGITTLQLTHFSGK